MMTPLVGSVDRSKPSARATSATRRSPAETAMGWASPFQTRLALPAGIGVGVGVGVSPGDPDRKRARHIQPAASPPAAASLAGAPGRRLPAAGRSVGSIRCVRVSRKGAARCGPRIRPAPAVQSSSSRSTLVNATRHRLGEQGGLRMTDYDLVVIGGGNTGLSASYGVAAAGRRVALVDRGPVGGLCSLAGCNPKKIFVRATEVLDEVRRAGEHGIETGDVSIDWHKVWRRKKSFTDPVPAETEASLRTRGIELIRGEARFVGPDRIAAGERVLTAEGFVVATGSHPRRLDFPGHELVRTSNDVLEIEEPPASMAIIGSGVVAFELGQVFARLGTKVTMLMRHDRALTGFDEDFIESVLRFSEDLGIEFWKHTEVRAASRAR